MTIDERRQVALADADQHYYEPVDAISSRLDPEFSYAFRWAVSADGRTRLLLGDRVFQSIPNPTFNPIPKPGALASYFRGKNQAGLDARSLIGEMEPIRPEYRDRDRRMEVLDQQGVETALLLPTLALNLEALLFDDAAAVHAVFRALNRWIDEAWGFSRDNRIIAPPALTLVDPALAEAELRWVIERGTKLIVLRPSPVVTATGGRSLGDPMYDRFWSMAAEAGVVIAFHAADSGYAKYAGQWGERTSFSTVASSPFGEVLGLHIERPIFETIAAIICHGVFDRHPTLRVATIELGSSWVPELVQRLRIAYGKIPQTFARDPLDALHDHVWITPFQEDHLSGLVELIGGDRVLFGSDWPHPEGMHSPDDVLSEVADLSEADQRRITHENLLELIGLI